MLSMAGSYSWLELSEQKLLRTKFVISIAISSIEEVVEPEILYSPISECPSRAVPTSMCGVPRVTTMPSLNARMHLQFHFRFEHESGDVSADQTSSLGTSLEMHLLRKPGLRSRTGLIY
jgi:hypothetical protein